MCYIFTCEKAIRPINFTYSIFHMWKYNQSSPRIEWLSQSEQSTQMASQLSWNQRPLEVCVLKTWLRLPVLVHFRKQQRNISNILVVSTSASTNSHLSKSYLCFKGDLRRNNQHFYTQRKSTESEFVFAQREAPSWTSEKISRFLL